MFENAVPKVDVEKRVTIALSLIAVAAGVIAAYYTGQTGEPHPLFVGCAGLTVFVLLFTSDE
ncbi:hypothetical protein [Halolamina sediminis]|jgi:hypothetical protein|uniref:hypothetical protein n=1 Tax=Halolamina sediminis TaxID=1480675 RepID=UPI0006B5B81F|nr:hypothetical protein [Halolamina sediminis]